jgi:peptidyl-prolyl cis-trans isomerase C
MSKASARHILVDSEDQCNQLEVAMAHSSCPSGQRGGDLGEFSPGMMVPEFDKVVFSGDLGIVHGPVKTQFGYHLLEITNRTE